MGDPKLPTVKPRLGLDPNGELGIDGLYKSFSACDNPVGGPFLHYIQANFCSNRTMAQWRRWPQGIMRFVPMPVCSGRPNPREEGILFMLLMGWKKIIIIQINYCCFVLWCVDYKLLILFLYILLSLYLRQHQLNILLFFQLSLFSVHFFFLFFFFFCFFFFLCHINIITSFFLLVHLFTTSNISTTLLLLPSPYPVIIVIARSCSTTVSVQLRRLPIWRAPRSPVPRRLYPWCVDDGAPRTVRSKSIMEKR